MRASSATTTASSAAAPETSATASCDTTGRTGIPSPRAMPCATPHATRKPVNPPGPWPKATACRASGARPARASNSRAMGNRRSACSWAPSCSSTATTGSAPCSVSKATPQREDEVSKASRFRSIGADCTKSGASPSM
ncbi:Uncharacterised protein [Bordetella pertussis]|nr:Uncharacterised protein [Bordetella pertussis]CFP66513.1 Uncharacterised protein [Bordetella pertussis]